MTEIPDIIIPDSMRPSDGRFGSGPSKVRSEAVAELARVADGYLGTSHRQDGVKFVVAELRNGLLEMFNAPDGYQIVMGNGGATLFWDAATFGLIENKTQHLVCGEFSSKFAKAVAAAPHLGDPDIIESAPGTAPSMRANPEVDAYCYPHNETSTGVALPVVRPEGGDGLVLVDATSGAGGLRFDAGNTDVYYFAPQKCFSSDGGLWIALCSPAAMERINTIAATDRWQPAGLDLKIALDNSLKDQTYNTPALATVFMTLQYTKWVNENGGLDFAASRSDRSSEILYGWANNSDYATPFVQDEAIRSHVVGTIDLDDRVDALTISKVLRKSGIIDTEGYRKLGRNQMRIAMFPGIEPTDIEALTNCIDYIVEKMS
ncbi:MAG: phosphoserine transaminase [Acidimicrobiales bacterium]|nr:phosphoserine transaminase [Acidimicrobiales bacterium]RZV45747.1 MAG: phosphoserine transaminase [Acidimicrobiales bacterium]